MNIPSQLFCPLLSFVNAHSWTFPRDYSVPCCPSWMLTHEPSLVTILSPAVLRECSLMNLPSRLFCPLLSFVNAHSWTFPRDYSVPCCPSWMLTHEPSLVTILSPAVLRECSLMNLPSRLFCPLLSFVNAHSWTFPHNNSVPCHSWTFPHDNSVPCHSSRVLSSTRT